MCDRPVGEYHRSLCLDGVPVRNREARTPELGSSANLFPLSTASASHLPTESMIELVRLVS